MLLVFFLEGKSEEINRLITSSFLQDLIANEIRITEANDAVDKLASEEHPDIDDIRSKCKVHYSLACKCCILASGIGICPVLTFKSFRILSAGVKLVNKMRKYVALHFTCKLYLNRLRKINLEN